MNFIQALPLIGNLWKVVFGNREQRDAQSHEQQAAIYQQFAAEFGPRERRTWWDSLIDGVNRLPRPLMTFGTIWIFWYAASDPAGFSEVAAALALVPYEGWVLLWMVSGFWFGTKAAEKLPRSFGVSDSLESMKGAGRYRTAEKDQNASSPSPESNTAISVQDRMEWDHKVQQRYNE